MEKTETMKRYEVETGKKFSHMSKRAVEGDVNCTMSTGYVAWLEAKAEAYDRLMSGNPTPKEIANLLGMVIAQNPNNTWAAFNSMPNLSFFTRRWETADKKKGLDITHCHIRYNDAWGNSLTLPDGWEEA